MHRILVGKDGLIINILEQMGDDHPLLIHRRDSYNEPGLDYFVDVSTGETAQIGDAYDLYDLHIDELRTNEPVLWNILFAFYRMLGDSPAPTEEEFIEFVRAMYPYGAAYSNVVSAASAVGESTAEAIGSAVALGVAISVTEG